MHLFFIDESGTPPKPGKDRPRYFVMAGVVIPETSWCGVRDDLLGLKTRRKIRGEIKWRHFTPGNDELRNPMRHLAHNERDAIRVEIFGIIGKPRHRITSIAAICSAAAAYEMDSVNEQEDIYHLTYKVLTERFQYYLQDRSNRSNAEFGIVVCDHRGAQDDKRLRTHHQTLIHTSSGVTSSYKNLVESLFLQPSHQSIGIQLADIVAGSIWRKYEREDDRFYEMVEPTLRRSASGQIQGYGLAKVPKVGWQ